MSTQDTNESNVQNEQVLSKKGARKKKGLSFLGYALICLIVSFALYSVNVGGLVFSLVSFAMFGCLVAGLIYLILGVIGKD